MGSSLAFSLKEDPVRCAKVGHTTVLQKRALGLKIFVCKGDVPKITGLCTRANAFPVVLHILKWENLNQRNSAYLRRKWCQRKTSSCHRSFRAQVRKIRRGLRVQLRLLPAQLQIYRILRFRVSTRLNFSGKSKRNN